MPEINPDKRIPATKFVLPTIQISPKQQHHLSLQPVIWVRKFILSGNTVFSIQQLRHVLLPYENRAITNEMLQTLRINLTRYYVERGYINSVAVIPDQEINNGTILIHIIEGQLSEIKITGNEWLSEAYIQHRIEQDVTSPLNIIPLQKRLQLLQQDLLLEHISAQLKPGLRAGESELTINVKEARPYQLGFIVSNDRSPSIGAENSRFWVLQRNLTGFSDRLFASYNLSEGLNDFTTSYSFPLTWYDTRLQFYYDTSDSEIITRFTNSESEPKITGKLDTYEVSLYQPVFHTLHDELSLTLAFQHRRSQTFLGEQGFGFAAGVADDGKSIISALRFSQDWIHRSQNQVIAIRSRFSFGLDVMDATINDTGPDGRFFSWIGQFQWLRQLTLFYSQILLRSNLQFSADPLLPLEKFSVGGQYSVRGYRENQLVRDNGINASLEWRIPTVRLPIPFLSQQADDAQLWIIPFFDFGWSENNGFPTPAPRTISSAGLGLRWSPNDKLHTQFYWAIPFRKIDTHPHDLQDSGIHFSIAIELL